MKIKSIDQAQHSGSNYKMMAPYLVAAEENGGHIHIDVEGYEPLTVEKLGDTDHKGRPVWAIAHWYTQHGDMMCDPDMTFSVDKESNYIIPLTYQMDGLGIYQEVFAHDERGLVYSKRLLTDLDRFLWQWLQNLKEQGFTDEAAAFSKGEGAA